MNCKCGHGISKHDMGGCQHTDRTKNRIDLVCRCGLSPDAIAEAQLTALREAGEKMAALLGEDITDDQLTEALEAWEAANK